MSLAHIALKLADHRAVRKALEGFEAGESPSVSDFPDAVAPALIAAFASRLGAPVLVVTTRRERADYLGMAVADYAGHETPVSTWHGPDALPYEQLPIDLEAGVRRANALHRMRTEGDRNPIWITPVSGLLQLLTPPDVLAEMTLDVRVGGQLAVEWLSRWATRSGYTTSPVVQEPGTIARRGGIVDIFPPGAEHPVRLDFFGDDIESIREFDPHSQRSIERLDRITLLPSSELPLWRLPEIVASVSALDTSSLRPEVADEWGRRIDRMRDGALNESLDLFAGYLVPEKSTLLDYLPEGTRIILDQPDALARLARQIDTQARDLSRTFQDSGELPAGLALPFVPARKALGDLRKRSLLQLGATTADDESTISAASIVDPHLFAGNLATLTGELAAQLADGWAISLATDQVERLTEIVEERGIYPRRDMTGPNRTAPPLEPGTVEIRPSF